MEQPEITIKLREFAEYFVRGTSPDTEPVEEFERPAWTHDTIADAEAMAIRLARQYRGEGFQVNGRDTPGSGPWTLVEIIECAPLTEADFDCFSEDYLAAMLPKGWTYDCGMTGFWIIGPDRGEGLYIPLRFLSSPPAGWAEGVPVAGEDASDSMGEPRIVGGPHEVREQFQSEPDARAQRRAALDAAADRLYPPRASRRDTP